MPANERFYLPITATEFIKEMVAKGLVPAGTTRIVIDSGQPESLVRVYWQGFADADMLQTLMDKALVPEWEVKPGGLKQP